MSAGWIFLTTLLVLFAGRFVLWITGQSKPRVKPVRYSSVGVRLGPFYMSRGRRH